MKNLIHIRREILFLVLFTISCILIWHFQNIICACLDFDWVAYGLLGTLGLFHGTNDLYLKIKDNSTVQTPIKFNRLGNYLIVGAVIFSLFLIFPIVGLCVFLLFSAYHFGEQHFYVDTKGFYLNSILFRFFYGTTVISGLAYANTTEVNTILNAYLNLNIDGFSTAIPYLFWGSFLTQGLYLLRLAFVYRVRYSDWFLYQIALMSLMLFFFATELLWSFTFYFIFWHSIPSLKLQIKNDFNRVALSEAKIFFKRGFPFYLITILAIIPIHINFEWVQKYPQLSIGLISAIVIPHIITIYKMLEYRSAKSKPLDTFNYSTDQY